MLHVCDFIKQYSPPLDYDGSRGEQFGKMKIKDNTRISNKQKLTFNFDIGHRINDGGVIDNPLKIFL